MHRQVCLVIRSLGDKLAPVLILYSLCFGGNTIAYGQSATEPHPLSSAASNIQGFATDGLMPDVYRSEVMRLLLGEANQIAGVLQLPEELPITGKNLVGKFISPPDFALSSGAIANVTTRLYTYYVSRGCKFSFLESTRIAQACMAWEKDYRWPLQRLDTNAAYQLATQWLAAATMDVSALNRDHRLFVDVDRTYVRPPPGTFIPLYKVNWCKPHTEGAGIVSSTISEWEPVASVFLFVPTKTLLHLRVEDPKYILRAPLHLTTLDPVAGSQKNAVRITNSPIGKPGSMGN